MEVWGSEECWGEEAAVEDRWRIVLSSGCSEGAELRRLWERLQREARVSADWLGEEVPGVLNTPVQGVGEGSVSGAIRGRVVQATENTSRERIDAREDVIFFLTYSIWKHLEGIVRKGLLGKEM